MDAMRAASHMTVEEFLDQPESERGIVELIDGEVVATYPNLEHQMVVGELQFALAIWCRSERGRGRVIGTIDTSIGPNTILVPDLQWYADIERLGDRRARPKPSAEIVVEVRSPSTWSRDVGVKRSAYEREGVPELWLIDPMSRTVLVYRRSTPSSPTFDVALDLADGDDLESPQLPGFSVPVTALFA